MITDEIEKNYFHICSQLACEVLNKILSKKKNAMKQQDYNKIRIKLTQYLFYYLSTSCWIKNAIFPKIKN